ncbi:MAG: molybdopterin-dependent oxidoreductase [Proteobacteria bacterium]|nr:molybdopterin-dependent oxidoreductase [Pseudomonadota bacterium]
MNEKSHIQEIRGYCSQCSCWCPTVSIVKEGVFAEVKADLDHPLGFSLCPKGLAGPQLVYNSQRLQFPMRRTRPKGDPDPGWERITWEEALDTVSSSLNEIKNTFGPEAIAVARCGPAGSPMGELGLWVTRFANALGTPNNLATTHICQWHRDCGSAYTYGNIGRMHSAGRAEFERSACILVWGSNTHATRHSLLPFIRRGLDRGAKLIVVDPRRTEIAAMADLWLQVRPGTDGALALSMIHEMIEEKLYDHEFVRDWTTAPFWVRGDTGDFLRASDVIPGGDPSDYTIMDADNGAIQACRPGGSPSIAPLVDGADTIRLVNGAEVPCKTVHRLLRELASQYASDRAQALTGIPKERIREASRLFATTKPGSWYSWNGIEQSINATQTNRAVCILYALTGSYDQPGGNVILRGAASNPVMGHDFLTEAAGKARLGFAERPLGPCGIFKSGQAYEVYKAILTGKPYPVKGMIGFGGNIIMSNAPSLEAKKALSQLAFHVQTELFLSPTAELADVVLPAASSWESWHVGANIGPLGDKSYIQLRPAVVPPQHESWPDMKIMFELARRLGLGEKFWDGDIESGFNHQFAPSKITVERLKASPGNMITLDTPMAYQKYAKKDEAGNLFGFPTPSKRVEIYSIPFKRQGHDPLPTWKEPISYCFPEGKVPQEYPLLLINSKVIEYCHSQHRAVPALRKRVPQPFLEMNARKAREMGIKDGDRVILETPHAGITLRAKPTEGIAYDVVCTQNGWWQSCEALDLPGYDPFSSAGANVNLLYRVDKKDPISGSLPHKGYPCNVRKVL